MTQTIHFTKMHGLGNDFMVVNAVTQTITLTPAEVQMLGNRRTGIGFDQLLMIAPPHRDNIDFRYRIFNADGSEVQQCGNGARCIARFIKEAGLSDQHRFTIGTKDSNYELVLEPNDDVSVNMQSPILEPSAIPFVADSLAKTYSITTRQAEIEISALSMGNPHCVLLVESLRDDALINRLGTELSLHPRFPQQCNVEFMQIINKKQFQLRIFERGVGETLACGSGACAAMVAGRLLGRLDAEVTVAMPGGNLQITWQGQDSPVWMKGPAVTVFTGTVILP